MVQYPPSVGTLTVCDGLMEASFLSTPLKVVETSSLIRTQVPLAWRTNGRVTFRVTIDFIGHMFEIGSVRAKRLRLCGSFDKKTVAVNEWRACIALVSISKQCGFCLANTSESGKHKFWDCIQARRVWIYMGHFHHARTLRGCKW